MCVLLLPAAALAKADVPLKGSDEGLFGLGAFCGADSFVVEIEGAGHASQLGAYDYEARECFNVVTNLYTGLFTMTAANGDEVRGSYSGQVHGTADPAVARYVQAGVITGGTGRFAGATGELTMDGIAHFTSSTGGDYTQVVSAVIDKS
jgi:hypothetical protein